MGGVERVARASHRGLKARYGTVVFGRSPASTEPSPELTRLVAYRSDGHREHVEGDPLAVTGATLLGVGVLAAVGTATTVIRIARAAHYVQMAAVPKGVSAVSNVGSKFCDVLPEIRVSSRLDPVLLSHDGSVQTAYRNDPLVTTTVTLKLVFELSQAIKRLKKRIHEIRTPFLAVHGSEDEIAPPEGSKLLVDALGSKDKRLVIIEASRHEVQNEKAEQREQFLEWISEWIKERAKQRSET